MRALLSFGWLPLAPLLAAALAAEPQGASPKGPSGATAAAETRQFEAEILPLLTRHCFACHSHAAGKMKGGLALDSRSGWAQGGESGPAIVPGNPGESLLLQAVRYEDENLQMPPNGKLPPQALAALESWIRSGAHDPRIISREAQWAETLRERRAWWSLQPVKKQPEPAVKNSAWCQGPIDRFILARLEAAGLEPAPAADRRTLVRRLSFALRGLPPTPDEVRQFVDDPAGDAYGRLVDRFLASPQFGEHWARHWMDVVHYADTHGYEWDIAAKGAWQYRDYLIRAFNADVSLRQLILEHVAGDLFDPPRVDKQLGLNESLLGTISLRLGERRHGDSAEFEGIHQEAMDNIIDTVSKAFQATTVACAHCHDHKRDAISQRDYYALAGVFMSTRWVCRGAAAADAPAAQLSELKRLKRDVKQQLAEQWRGVTGELAAALLNPPAASPLAKALSAKDVKLESPAYVWKALRTGAEAGRLAEAWAELGKSYTDAHRERTEKNAQQYQVLGDFTRGELDPAWHVEGWGLRHGLARHGELIIADEGPTVVREIVPAGLYTHLWSPRWGGALRSGLLDANVKYLAWEGIAGGLASRQVFVDNSLFPESRFKFLDDSRLGWTVEAGLPDQSKTARRVWLELNTKEFNNYYPPRTGLVMKYSATQQDDARSWFGVTKVYAGSSKAPPQDDLNWLLPLVDGAAPESLAAAADRFAEWCRAAVDRWNADQADADDIKTLNWLLQHELLPNRASDAPLAALVDGYRELAARLPDEPVVGAVADYQEGRNERIGIRGSYLELGDVAPRGFIAFLSDQHDFATQASGRWQLAQSIADPANPLTARVFVNRAWHYLFGTGLVRTVDDFGHLGEVPSHPELLDTLAQQFMDEGWSLKQLVRQLVLSAAWQQSDRPSDAAREKDPENRLWHHMPLRRLTAEELRDSLLAVSGRLDARQFGPAIDPWRRAEDKPKRLLSGPLDGRGRRSVYVKMTLMEPPKFLAIFNQPVPKLTIGKRDVTSVPDQSLALLNDPFVHDQAEFWSRRLLTDGASTAEARIERMFVEALGRPPLPAERDRLADLAGQLAKLHQVSEANCLASGAIWKDIAHAVFNLKEFLYIR